MTEAGKEQIRIETCRVGMFNLPGVIVHRAQFTEEQLTEIEAWARENSAYVGGNENQLILSWRDEAKRDWFLLKWS